ncbi:hypothetical protein AB6A40_001881 [Gnathostoma spinigerum]|uniref:Uncharacterized protein n=1 Tax=Gnathostoma spinigerum TaxID=75299 RepID=A0ABD6EF71_9BILA
MVKKLLRRLRNGSLNAVEAYLKGDELLDAFKSLRQQAEQCTKAATHCMEAQKTSNTLRERQKLWNLRLLQFIDEKIENIRIAPINRT